MIIKCPDETKLMLADDCKCFCSCFSYLEKPGTIPDSWPCGGLLQTYTIHEKSWVTQSYPPETRDAYDVTLQISYNNSGLVYCRWGTDYSWTHPFFLNGRSSFIGFMWRPRIVPNSFGGWFATTEAHAPRHSTNLRDPRGSYSFNDNGGYYTQYFEGTIS